MTNRLGHTLLRGILQPGRRHYLRCTNALEATQRSQLRRLLGQVSGVTGHRQHSVSSGWSWEQFAERQPVTEFADWRTLIEAQLAGRTPLLTSSPVMRYQPTSGSTSAIKWIPYTQQFLRELDAAIGPWLGFPEINTIFFFFVGASSAAVALLPTTATRKSALNSANSRFVFMVLCW